MEVSWGEYGRLGRYDFNVGYEAEMRDDQSK